MEQLTIWPEKKKLVVSFSGGATSGYMLWWIFNEWEKRHEYEILVVFANTGKEKEETLLFVDECSQEWNIPIFWLEYHPKSKKGRSIEAKVVDYENASRKGEPFEKMIACAGIPNVGVPFCSTMLKKETIEAFLRQISWKNYTVAIGIRADEAKRISKSKRRKVIYPLWKINPKTKEDIAEWWAQQTFKLQVHPDSGNCDNCWKKGILRLARNAQRDPKSYDWWQLMTDRYGHFNPRNTHLLPPFNFYRGNLSPKDILYLSTLPVEEITKMATREKLDSCSTSCEAF